jgi:hypothetical protein
MPPHMAINEFKATRPVAVFTDCALMTLKPNQPMHKSQEPKASHVTDDGGVARERPLSYRPRRGPNWRMADRPIQPPTA